MVDYDLDPITDDQVRAESEPFEFSSDERASLREIKKSLNDKCTYEQLTDFREYLEELVERVNTAVRQSKELNYDTTDIEVDLQFLRDLQRKVVLRQHDEM